MKKVKMILFCILISWITLPNQYLYAEEEMDQTETQMLAENVDEFLENLKIEDESEIMTFSADLYKGERVGKHYHNGEFISYITKMYVDGQLAYCLEPTVLIPGGVGSSVPGYEASSVLSYDRLDYATKVKVWKIAYYGYGYGDHTGNDWFAATQCLIWEAINEPQQAYTMSDEPWDLTEIKNEIMQLVEMNPAGKVPSFAGSTIKLSLHKAAQLIDQNQVLSNYAVPDAKNITVNQNGNHLTLTLEDSLDFASSLNASGSVYNALLQSVIWKNENYQIMFTQHYEPMKDFSIFFELDSVPFTIVKLDHQNGQEPCGEADLKGAVISIRNALDQMEVVRLSMKDSNMITYENLPAGDYLACEVIPPKGYQLNTQCVPFSTKTGNSPSVEILDEVIQGQIQILKKDEETGKAPLDQAEFAIFDLDGKQVDTVLITDGKGISQFLPYGHYTIREVLAPKGYVLSDESQEVFIQEEDQILTVEFTNKPQKGQILVTKLDESSGNIAQGEASLEGVVYQIFAQEAILGYDGMRLYDQDDLVETIKADGVIATSSILPLGIYRICEQIPSLGYNRNEGCEIVELKAPEQAEALNLERIDFTNKVIEGQIAITKFIVGDEGLKEDRNSGVVTAGKGFSFEVIALSSNEIVDTLITDENGYAISKLLPYGRYQIKELNSEGYEAAKEFEVMINEEGKIYRYIVENDVFEAELTLYKIDQETKKRVVLPNASFKIKNGKGEYIKQTITYPQKIEIDTFTTDETGSIHLPSPLSYGTYSICEVQAPYGYVLNENELEFQVDGSSKEIVIEFEDMPVKGNVIINKTGEVLSGFEKRETPFGWVYVPQFEKNILDGVTYRIFAREDIITPDQTLWYHANEIVEEITTIENEPIASSRLPLGAYSLQEIRTKDGYVRDEQIYDFDLTYENQSVEVVTYSFYHNNERKKGVLHYSKVFESSLFHEDSELKKDTVFGLFNAEDIWIEDELVLVKGSMLGYSLLNQDFSGKFDLNWAGNYFIQEICSPEGYELNKTEYSFTFDFSDTEEAVVHLDLGQEILNETKKGSLTLLKCDEFKDEPLVKEGFVFEVAADESFERIIAREKTDENGIAFFENLEIGTYYVREIQSVDPYLLSSEVIKIEIVEDEISEIVFENRYREVGLTIVKMNEKEELLDEAEFVLIDITEKKMQEVYFMTLGTDVELSELFSDNVRLLSSDDSIISLCAMKAHAHKEGEVIISAIDAEGRLQKVILVRSVNTKKEDRLFWKEECEIEEGNLIIPDMKDQILFKGRTGHVYLHLVDLDHHNLPLANQQVAFYSDKEEILPYMVKITDDAGMISVDDLTTGKWFYQIANSQERKEIEIVKSSGELFVEGLKWGRTYLLIETVLPTGMTYSSSPISIVKMDLKEGEDIVKVNIYNQTRKASLKVVKMNETQDKKLNGASFILKDKESDEELEEKISGVLFLKDVQTRYFLSKDEEMNEIISILEPNEWNEIFETLPEGNYYLQKMGEKMEEIQRIEIEKGTLIFHDLEVNKEYILYESEAPAGYLKEEEEINVLLNPDFLSDMVELRITNVPIKIPNMGDW